LVIADGGIAEQGPHEELMQTGGIYKHFVTARENSRGWSRSRLNKSTINTKGAYHE